MGNDAEIRRLLNAIVQPNSKTYQVEVISFDLENGICVGKMAEDEEENSFLYDIRLSSVNDPNFLIVPKIGSLINVVEINGDLHLLNLSEVDRYKIANENMNLKNVLSELIGQVSKLNDAVLAITLTVTGTTASVPTNAIDFTNVKIELEKQKNALGNLFI